MFVLKPNPRVDHLNETQFMMEAWLCGLTYEEYAASAEHCTKHLFSAEEYRTACANWEAEEVQRLNQAKE